MKFDKSLLSGSTAMLVLSLLRDGDKYGYEMISQLALRSDDRFQLKEGTLYPVLHGLERDGCIEGYEGEAQGGRARRYYRLTRRGKTLLDEQTAQWRQFSGAVEQVLGERCAL